MKKTMEPAHLKDLISLFRVLDGLQERLLILIREKLQAMRSSDMALLQSLSLREQKLIESIQEREGLRQQIMDCIGRELGLAARAGRTMTVSQLSTYLPERSALLLENAASELRTVVAKVAQANRVAGATSREIVNHLSWVFASVRATHDSPVCYSGDGGAVGVVGARLLDAVG